VADAKSSMPVQSYKSEPDLGKFIGNSKEKWNAGIRELRNFFGRE